MESLKSTLGKLRGLISSGEIGQALFELQLLVDNLEDELLSTEVNVFFTRYSLLFKDIHFGLITYDQTDTQRNRIILSILEFLKLLEDFANEKKIENFNESLVEIERIKEDLYKVENTFWLEQKTQIEGLTKQNNWLTDSPPLEGDFIGRESEIVDLFKAINTQTGVHLIYGMGGIGKTTIVLYFLKRFWKRFNNIVWVEQTGKFSIDLATN